MYERPDVPKDSPNRNKVAVIVLLAVAVALAGLVMGPVAACERQLGLGQLGCWTGALLGILCLWGTPRRSPRPLGPP